MEKIDKFIAKLQPHIAHRILPVLIRIRANDLAYLDVKKLRGRPEEYRVRIGDIRIKFKKARGKNIVTDIGFRDDNTY